MHLTVIRILFLILPLYAVPALAETRVVDAIEDNLVRFDDGSLTFRHELPTCAWHEGAVLVDGECAPALEAAMRVNLTLKRQALEELTEI